MGTATYFYRATIAETAQASILNHVPFGVYQDIKNNDPHPVFALYEIGSEGVSKGSFNGTPTPKRWGRAAIMELVSKVSGGKLWRGNHSETDKPNRKSFGEIIGGFVDKAKAYAVAYIADSDTRNEIKRGNLDTCSIEAEVEYSRSASEIIIEGVRSVAGLLLANSKIETPGFSGAKLVGSVAELRTALVDETATLNPVKEGRAVDIQEVKKWLAVNDNVKPSDLFKGDVLSKDAVVIGIVSSAVDESKTDAAKDNAKMQKALEKAEGDLKPFRESAAKDRAAKMIADNEKVKALSKTQAEAAQKIALMNVRDISGMTDAELATAIDAAIETAVPIASMIGANAGTGEGFGNPNPTAGSRGEVNVNPFSPDVK